MECSSGYSARARHATRATSPGAGAPGVEPAYLRDADGDSRRDGLARVARRFTTRWARRALAPCPDALDTAGALAALEAVRADAAGDATVAALRELAPPTGRPLGSAAEVERLDPDPAYQPTLVREFDSLTPQSALKWGIVHPEPNRWDFDPADRMLALAETNGMRLRGHTLVWGGAVDPPNPTWLETVTDPDELRAIVRDHVTTLVRRYAGRIPLWDAVNEPLRLFGDAGESDGLAENHSCACWVPPTSPTRSRSRTPRIRGPASSSTRISPSNRDPSRIGWLVSSKSCRPPALRSTA
jgi:Glycosyl hydrolase family 10